MGLQGLRRVRKIKEEQDRRREDRGAYLPFFSLQDGEEAEIWFHGPESEPFIYKQHSYNPAPKVYRTHVCSKPKKGKCVDCYEQKKGNRKVGFATDQAGFNVLDTRWVHKRLDEEATKKANGNERFQYLPCVDDETCKYCKKKTDPKTGKKRRAVPRVRAGRKRASWSMTWANAILGVDEQLKKKCKGCGIPGAKIKVIGHQCCECGADMEYEAPEIDVDEELTDEEIQEKLKAKCRKCKKKGVPVEVLSCTKCDNPERGDIQSCPVVVSRQGSGRTTSYSFTPQLPFREKEEWMLEDDMQPVDLANVFKADSFEKQAEILGVRNPFGGEKGKQDKDAVDYDSDDEEEEEEEDDEDSTDPFDDDEEEDEDDDE